MPTMRFETGPGEQAQVDWGSTALFLGEARVRVHLFTMVLGFSRRIFAKGYLSEGLDPLLDGHAAAFAHFGGRTRSILYDNPRTIVTSKDEAAGHVVWNATFKDRLDFYGVVPRLCRFYRAQTKGKGESGVKVLQAELPARPDVPGLRRPSGPAAAVDDGDRGCPDPRDDARTADRALSGGAPRAADPR